jgi:hypothetical protein
MAADICSTFNLISKGADAAGDAVHLVAFGQQELGQIRAVLAGDAGDEGFFSHSGECVLAYAGTNTGISRSRCF